MSQCPNQDYKIFQNHSLSHSVPKILRLMTRERLDHITYRNMSKDIYFFFALLHIENDGTKIHNTIYLRHVRLSHIVRYKVFSHVYTFILSF
jgi:hypothetical protein